MEPTLPSYLAEGSLEKPIDFLLSKWVGWILTHLSLIDFFLFLSHKEEVSRKNIGTRSDSNIVLWCIS